MSKKIRQMPGNRRHFEERYYTATDERDTLSMSPPLDGATIALPPYLTASLRDI